MERIFEHYGQTLKIDSKLLDKVLSVYEELCTDDSKISVTTDLKWNDKYRITRDSFLTPNSEQAIIGNNALVVSIENCPNINAEMQARILNPFIEAVSSPRLLKNVVRDWREDITMVVDENQEITTYHLNGFMIKESSTKSITNDSDITICFDAAQTFASRTFKD